MGSIKLNLKKNEGSERICKSFGEKYKDLKEKIRSPFDKAHRELNK
jgi:hypothetical protein